MIRVPCAPAEVGHPVQALALPQCFDEPPPPLSVPSYDVSANCLRDFRLGEEAPALPQQEEKDVEGVALRDEISSCLQVELGGGVEEDVDSLDRALKGNRVVERIERNSIPEVLVLRSFNGGTRCPNHDTEGGVLEVEKRVNVAVTRNDALDVAHRKHVCSEKMELAKDEARIHAVLSVEPVVATHAAAAEDCERSRETVLVNARRRGQPSKNVDVKPFAPKDGYRGLAEARAGIELQRQGTGCCPGKDILARNLAMKRRFLQALSSDGGQRCFVELRLPKAVLDLPSEGLELGTDAFAPCVEGGIHIAG